MTFEEASRKYELPLKVFHRLRELGLVKGDPLADGDIHAVEIVRVVYGDRVLLRAQLAKFNRATREDFVRTAELAKPEPTEEGAEQCAATTDKPAELTEQEIAALEQKVLDDKAQEVDDQREAMLTTVQGMNKTALTEYAKKYDHSFDPKAKVDDMRITVNGLIHQFGVR